MPIITHRPITPGTRFLVRVKTEGLHTGRPERSLTEFKHRAMGRNCYGRITSRRRGGGHKKLYRAIDFRRDRLDPRPPSSASSTIRTALRTWPSSSTPTRP
jgi:large subunit ribosomal protein L2